MTPDADDLSSTFVPHVSQSFITQTPLRSSHMHHDLYQPRASYNPDPASSSVEASRSEPLEGPSSFDDGFKKIVKIDMKDLVGDAVGNMSISPSYRDVVLAARKGLFIIDLEAPLELPRFLPQGGTWDVADVQWNPHPGRAEYIVSTSSEKLLIWNLYLSGKTSIEHVLHSHYRAITDINWHTQDPDIVVSTGIDSWLWAWDLRTPSKPVMGLSAFNAQTGAVHLSELLLTTCDVMLSYLARELGDAGTQVKWNRQDGNVLASSHKNEVLIWDRRKGSIPVTRIQAHSAKIYGIDWAHNSSREIVTCSLDKTIKVWDVHDLEGKSNSFQRSWGSSNVQYEYEPQTVIRTMYPVWRARDLPFGKGVLSLPQRSEHALEMWTHGPDQPQPMTPVEVFEGHTDVVKEFVWRRGGPDWNEFQLITWSKDKTLRLWPVEADAMQRAGQPSGTHALPRTQGYADNGTSFRTPDITCKAEATFSAPVGHRGILAEVRAAPPSRNPGLRQRHQPLLNRTSIYSSTTLGPHGSIRSRRTQSESELDQTPTTTALPIPNAARHGGTMSKGNVGGKSARVDAVQWLSNVRIGDKGREGSSGTGSGQNSGNASRIGSRSRQSSRDPPTGPGQSLFSLGTGGQKRSDSRSRWEGDTEEQSLQNEITTVLTKLSASKIKLEKHDLTKRRTCTLGLNGPWGETSSVFIRVSFTFPKDYPLGLHPEGTPSVELERTPLISMRNRALMLRRLRTILRSRRPCLEACLRFLLFRNEDQQERQTVHMGFESSSDEDESAMFRRGRDTGVTVLQNDKNIAEPRTSQGVFGPNGQLICFTHAPVRISHNPLHDPSASSSAPPTSSDMHSVPRLFQSPALLSDAIRNLTLSSHDRPVSISGSRHDEDGDNILHAMTNLLSFSRLKQRRGSEQSRLEDLNAGYSLLPARLMTVFLKEATFLVGADRELAKEYVFDGPLDDPTPAGMCMTNVGVAKKHGRSDHERFFHTIGMVFSAYSAKDVSSTAKDPWDFNPLAIQLVMEMYNEFAREKDVQMLAMVAVMLLKMYRIPHVIRKKSPSVRVFSPSASAIPRVATGDYFAVVRRRKDNRAPPLSPVWNRTASSPTANLVSTSLSSLSSRGSWSSLFNTGSMRQLMTGTQQETTREIPYLVSGSGPENEIVVTPNPGVRKHLPSASGLDSPPSRRKGRATDLNIGADVPAVTSIKRIPVAFTPGHVQNSQGQHPTFSQVVSARTSLSTKSLVVNDYRETLHQDQARSSSLFQPPFIEKLVDHILAYAEMLFRWELLQQRLELLKSISQELQVHVKHNAASEQNHLGSVSLCTRCENDTTPRGHRSCSSCHARLTMPLCSICRLPVKGLCYSCLACNHVSHAGCWKTANMAACATGCGCVCKGIDARVNGQDSLGQFTFSPQPISSQPLP